MPPRGVTGRQESMRPRCCPRDPMSMRLSVALHTTWNHLASWSASGRGNYSLCHGIAGNAGALLAGQHSRLDFAVSSADAVSDAAGAGLERYAHRGASWPCGVHGGQNPSLVIGLAGIGLFYLRMADDAVPSRRMTPYRLRWLRSASRIGDTTLGLDVHSERARP
ncbi:lanthionine synthetase LanC family protein [Pseudonocardia adelaidensis]|uniref:lanthionine synthetase LanC family protein n=1 Tax=Pseudonocardia adelaidensis TaxID=648754 RepID=UPI003CD077B7